MEKVVIIGGMAAGCKTATRLKRIKPDCDITIVEKLPFVSFGACGMPFFAAGDIDSFDAMMKTQFGMLRDEEYFGKVKGVKTLTNTIAESIDHDKRQVICTYTESKESLTLDYDYLVLAIGARPGKAKFPVPDSENISTFHNPLDSKRFRQKAQTGQIGSVMIVGGGYIGCEVAEAMVAMWGMETYLVEITDRLLPGSIDKETSRFIENQLTENDIELRLSAKVKEITLDDNGSPVTHLESGESIATDYVFLCMGVQPVTDLARQCGVKLGALGGIVVDKHMKTNVDNIWAAGDCVEITHLANNKPAIIPLGSLANRQGRVIADSIAGYSSEFKGASGAGSVKIFGVTLACCGLNRQRALDSGFEVEELWASFYDRPDYMDERQNLFAKMLYDKSSKKLLGLQLIGKGELTRYIDNFSSLIAGSAKISDLEDVEHAYTPPHSGPLNPLNNLGYMAANQTIDNVRSVSPLELSDFKGTIIDVRETDEIESAPSPVDTIHTGLKDMREFAATLDKTGDYLVVCQKGPRSYEMARLMKNMGFANVKYMGGGFQFEKCMI